MRVSLLVAVATVVIRFAWSTSFVASEVQLSGPIELPVIDIETLMTRSGSDDHHKEIIQSIKVACEERGFFYIKSGMDFDLISRLEEISHLFFGKRVEEKERIAMHYSGKAWRGYFKVGDELTSGKKDMKEGLYFGKEEPDYNGSMPLRGKNLFPTENDLLQLRANVLDYMKSMKKVATVLMQAISEALEADLETHFADNPTELFRIFSYPSPENNVTDDVYGVGEHTDYGFLTILYQDNAGGLQVKSGSNKNGNTEWMDVPPLPGTHVVNLGDALEHYTHGRFQATPHRVIYYGRKASSRARLSFPYFFDPHFDAPMTPMADPGVKKGRSHISRWDGSDPTQFQGTYGDYLQRKISKVFPQLFAESISSDSGEL